MRLLQSFFVVACLLAGTVASAQTISYNLSMPEPHTHYFEVEVRIDGLKQSTVDMKMPVWAPGSYLVREFAKSVEAVEATTPSGKKLSVDKSDKNTWQVQMAGNKQLVFSYRVYAYEMSVRTSFIDAEHAYLNGTSVFMYPAGMKEKPSTLTIEPYKEWKKVSTSLESTGNFTYKAPNYDILVDSPIEIGNHKEISFTASGVEHVVAIFGEGNYDEAKLKKDMANIVEACTGVFGFNPNKRYVFIIHNLTVGSGGLEHLASTTLQVSRWNYEPESKYQGFLSLVAHEYFHLWNVKRIRPKELGPFDYDHEVYTDLLWVMEGFTSYYDEYLLRRAGVYDQDKILGKFAGSISSIENQPGSKVQPVAHSSFDAWIKAYRWNENSYNTTISYYTKGAVLAMLLDLEIRHSTAGKKSLDDLLQTLYKEFYEGKNRGFTEEEFQATVEKVAGKKLTDFFENYVYGTQTPDYNKYFNFVGQQLVDENAGSTKPQLGIRAREGDDRRLTVSTVIRGTAAYDAGINVNDEIIAIDNFRIRTVEAMNDQIARHVAGDKVPVTLVRDGMLMTLEVELRASTAHRYRIVPNEAATTEQKALFDDWMRAR